MCPIPMNPICLIDLAQRGKWRKSTKIPQEIKELQEEQARKQESESKKTEQQRKIGQEIRKAALETMVRSKRGPTCICTLPWHFKEV